MSYHTEKEHSFVENDVDDATYDDPYDPTYHEHSYRDDHLSHQEEENPPPPPRTRPHWREPSEPVQAEYHHAAVNRHVASRQTSQTSSINAMRRNWEGATDWRNPKKNP